MSRTMMVRGFDFDTTEEALMAHCSVAGSVTGVRFKKKGTAFVTYASPEEAASAVEQLQGSYLDGQQRYVDCYLDGHSGGGGRGNRNANAVAVDDEVERFIADHGLDERAAKALRTESAEVVRHVLDRGPVVGCANPSSAVMSRLRDAGREVGSSSAPAPPARAPRAAPSSAPSAASAGRQQAAPSGPREPRGPAGTEGCTVNIHNIDFGTSQAALEQHFGAAGEIVNFRFKNKGTAQITFATPDDAQAAIDVLSGTMIEGCERVIEVRLAGVAKGAAAPSSAAGPAPGSYPTENGAAAQRAPPTMPSGRPQFNGAWDAGTQAKRKFSSGAVPGQRDRSPVAKRRKLRKRRGENVPAWAYGSDGRRVYIRGFDFDTSEARIREHIQRAGPVQNFCMMSQGSAMAVYHTSAAAKEAVRKLDRSTIAGNQRYVEVKLDTKSLPEGGAPAENGEGGEADGEEEFEGEAEGEDEEGMEEAINEEELAKQLLEAEDADAGWQRALAEAWELFCAAKPPAARTVGAFLNGLPDEAKLALKVKGSGGR